MEHPTQHVATLLSIGGENILLQHKRITHVIRKSTRAILVRGLKVRQSSAASIASGYYDRRTRARNIFILRCGTKDHVLLVPESRQWINSGRSPCRRIAS